MGNSGGFWHRTGAFLGFTAPDSVAPEVREVSSTGAVIPPPRASADSITVETALGIGAVYRAVQVIVTAVSQMEMQVVRNGEVIRTPSLVQRPDVNTTASAFVQETVFSLAAHGNAYWRVYRRLPGRGRERYRGPRPDRVWPPPCDVDSGRIDVQPIDGRDGPRAGRSSTSSWSAALGRLSGLGPIQAAPW